jgi:hypothetical protein
MIPLLIAGGAALGSAAANIFSSNQASKQLQEGIEKGGQAIREGTAQAAGYQQPYYNIGTQNAQTLSNLTNQGAFQVNPYQYQNQEQQPKAWTPTTFNFQADPGYQFNLSQGMNAVNSGAAARGNLLSGATLKALQRYGSGLAAQTYNDAFSQYMQGNQLGLASTWQALGQYNTNRSAGMQNEMNRYSTANQQAMQKYGQYENLANMGQGAANNLTNLYSNQGLQLGNLAIGQGTAQAAGTMGVGNAISSGLRTLGNLGTLYSAMQPQQSQQYQYSPQQSSDLTNMGFAYNPQSNGWVQNNIPPNANQNIGQIQNQGMAPLTEQELWSSYKPSQQGW